MAEEFDIAATNPAYDDYIHSWTVMRDTVDGEDCIKDKGETYLPMKSGIKYGVKDAGRQKHAYDTYKARAEFPEIVSPTVTGSQGLVGKPTKIELPSGLEPLREKATKDGLTLENLHARVVTELLRMGRYGLMPGVDAQGNLHLAGYVAEAIRNWEMVEGVLTYLVLDESAYERNPATNKWEFKSRYRECYISDGAYTSREWEKQKTADGKEKWIPGEEVKAMVRGTTPFPRIPFTFVGSTDLTPDPDDVPLYGLAKLALRAYRLDADYTNSLHLTAEPTPWVSGVDKENAPTSIGAANLWVLASENAKAGMLEFEGAGISAQREAITDTLERAITFGAQLIADTSKTAESGEAKRLRYSREQASLKSISSNAAAGLEHALRDAAEWVGQDPEAVEVEPNMDFVDRALTPQEIDALVRGWQSGGYSKSVLFHNLQRGEVIPADVTEEEEEERIANEPPRLTGNPLNLGG
jgi:hypothetical protein